MINTADHPQTHHQMSYTTDDVRGHIQAAIKQMQLALAAERHLRDGDLRDHEDAIWHLASFEFMLHTDLDDCNAFNQLLESRIEDHAWTKGDRFIA